MVGIEDLEIVVSGGEERLRLGERDAVLLLVLGVLRFVPFELHAKDQGSYVIGLVSQ